MPAEISPRRLLVTGGGGFVGSNLVHWLSRSLDAQGLERVVVLDAFTHAGQEASLAGATADPRIEIVRGDVTDPRLVAAVFAGHAIDAVIHLADGRVDPRAGAGPCVRTNVLGTVTVLDAALHAWRRGLGDRRFVHVSPAEAHASPYAASRVAAETMARSWWNAHGLPVVAVRAATTYGPRQVPGPIVPSAILAALDGRAIAVPRAALGARDFLFVDDLARGLFLALRRGAPGDILGLRGAARRATLDVIRTIADRVESRLGWPAGSGRDLVRVESGPATPPPVPSRAQDARLSVGFRPRVTITAGLAHTIDWYVDNPAWREAVLAPERERRSRRDYGWAA